MRKKPVYLLVLLLILMVDYLQAHTKCIILRDLLIPVPQEMTIGNNFLTYRQGRIICTGAGDPEIFHLANSVQEIFKIQGHFLPISAIEAKDEVPVIKIKIDEREVRQNQGYRLTIDSSKISLTAHDKAGLFYGVQTLRQIADYALLKGGIPVLQIQDWPDFERRGVMLDISRDKVPQMKTLYSMIDLLASWKINEFQLYTEHTFAYKNHPEVWQNSSPMTAQEIIELERYCKERFIDLVPNQNSFGHMERWLQYDKFLPLAECPTPCLTKEGLLSRTSLSPAVPGSLALMDELYSEMLPNFSSKYLNIGCDETVELGFGRSHEMCEKKGTGKVYLNYLKELRTLASKQGKKVQFWGDIILHYPELIPDLPKDMTAMVWGYEENYPFETQCPKFKDSGLEFYVCPGTSTWDAITGRTMNALGNLSHAAIEGKKYKAKGFLNTNWGDYGNWQPQSTYYPGFLYGAALSWSVENNKNIDIAGLLDKWVFKDQAGKMGNLVMDLGNVYRLTGVEFENQTILFTSLRDIEKSLGEDENFKRLTLKGVNRADSALAAYINRFEQTNLTCSDAEQVYAELLNAARLCRHSCRMIKDKLASKDGSLKNISKEERQFLIEDLSQIIAQHKQLWLQRDRIGGLSDSTEKLEKILHYYQTTHTK